MLRNKNVRPNLRKPSIPAALVRLATRPQCSVCTVFYGKIINMHGRYVVPIQNLDHIVPWRMVLSNSMNPNEAVNLISVCNRCNNGKRVAEDRLFHGDALTFASFINRKHWPINRVRAAFLYYGFEEVVKLLV